MINTEHPMFSLKTYNVILHTEKEPKKCHSKQMPSHSFFLSYLLRQPFPLLLQHVGDIISFCGVLRMPLPLFFKVKDHL